MQSEKITLRVVGPRGHGDEPVDDTELVGAVLPSLVERYGNPLSDVWVARPQKELDPLDPLRSFREQGVANGGTLHVEPLGIAPLQAGWAVAQNNQAVLALIDRSIHEFFPERITTRSQRAERALRAFVRGTPTHSRDHRTDLDATIAGGLLTDKRRGGRLRRAIASTSYEARLDGVIARGRVRHSGVVSVVGTSPGVGKSTVAMLVASTLAELRKERVVLVEGDPEGHSGSVAPSEHRTRAVSEIASRMRDADHGGRAAVSSMLSTAPNGLRVIPANAPERIGHPTPEDYAETIRALREQPGLVVVDCGPELYSHTTAVALHESDQVLLVTGPDPLSSLATAQALHDLRTLNCPVTIVVTRYVDSTSDSGRLHLPKGRKAAQRRDDALRARRGVDLTRLVGITSAGDRLALCVIEEDESGAQSAAAGTFALASAPPGWKHFEVRELAAVIVGWWAASGVGVISA